MLMGLKAVHSDVIMSAFIFLHFSFLNDVFLFLFLGKSVQ